MDFALTRSRKEIQKAVRDFARGEFEKEKILELLRTGAFPEDTRKKACELGFCSIHYPQEYDGGGLGLFEYVLAAEEMCRKDSAMGIALMLAGFGAECLYRFGKNQAAKQYLPALSSGKIRSAAAFSENMKTGGISGIKSFAKPENSELIINGTKTCVANGKSAAFYVVLCRTGQEQDAPEKNLSLICVPSEFGGISVKPSGPTLGANLIDFADVTFENVRVPEQNILGKPGRGLSHWLDFMDEARIQTASMALGLAQGAFARTAGYVKQRKQFGRRLASFQSIRHKLAEMYAEINTARWTVYNAAHCFDNRKCDSKTAAAAKLTATAAASAVTDQAVQILGGYGYMTEYEVEHFYRDAKTLELFTGAPGALKDAIAGDILGKPA